MADKDWYSCGRGRGRSRGAFRTNKSPDDIMVDVGRMPPSRLLEFIGQVMLRVQFHTHPIFRDAPKDFKDAVANMLANATAYQQSKKEPPKMEVAKPK